MFCWQYSQTETLFHRKNCSEKTSVNLKCNLESYLPIYLTPELVQLRKGVTIDNRSLIKVIFSYT